MLDFLLKSQVSKTEKECNEDAFRVGSSYVIVVDGATPLEGETSNCEVSQFANALGEEFSHRLEADLQSFVDEPSKVVEQVRKAVVENTIASNMAVPTAVVAIVAISGNEVTCYNLGDVAIYHHSSKIRRIVDPDWDGSDAKILRAVDSALQSGVPADQAYDSIHEELVARRKTRNTASGSWVLGAVGQAALAAEHGTVTRFPVAVGDDILVVSDGFERFVQFTGSSAPLFGGTSLQEAMQTIRTVEDSDVSRTQFPRMSVHDDATAVAVKVQE